MTDASYQETLTGGVPVVATPAEIDITTVGQLRATLLHATRNGHPVVVVDMTGTRFCDCAGLQTLIAAWKRMHAESRELRLVLSSGGTVRRIMDLTGVDRFIPGFAHLEEALAKPPCPADLRPDGVFPPAADSSEPAME